MKSTYNMTQFPEHLELYNLKEDPSESKDQSKAQPEIVEKLLKMADEQINELGQYDQYGPGVRKTLYVNNPKYILE